MIEVFKVKIFRVKKSGSGFPRPLALLKNKHELSLLTKKIVAACEQIDEKNDIEQKFVIDIEFREIPDKK